MQNDHDIKLLQTRNIKKETRRPEARWHHALAGPGGAAHHTVETRGGRGTGGGGDLLSGQPQTPQGGGPGPGSHRQSQEGSVVVKTSGRCERLERRGTIGGGRNNRRLERKRQKDSQVTPSHQDHASHCPELLLRTKLQPKAKGGTHQSTTSSGSPPAEHMGGCGFTQ